MPLNSNSHSDNEFKIVTSEKERSRVFSEMGATQAVLSGFAFEKAPSVSNAAPQPTTSQLVQFIFRVLKVAGEQIHAEPASASARPLEVHESIELLCGLSDGQYVFRSRVEKVQPGSVIFAGGGELLRLQRRSNFRIRVADNSPIKFKLLSWKDFTFPKLILNPVDLSAGGMRVRWNLPPAPPPVISASGRTGASTAQNTAATAPIDGTLVAEGDALTGQLQYPPGQNMLLSGLVKAVLNRNEGREVGFEFVGLSPADSQALMLLCMQVYRQQSAGNSDN